ncbi:hypothetical protein BGZ73_008541, partial [Actinomortierella ambigua]
YPDPILPAEKSSQPAPSTLSLKRQISSTLRYLALLKPSNRFMARQKAVIVATRTRPSMSEPRSLLVTEICPPVDR